MIHVNEPAHTLIIDCNVCLNYIYLQRRCDIYMHTCLCQVLYSFTVLLLTLRYQRRFHESGSGSCRAVPEQRHHFYQRRELV